jgi:GntR family transcriptional regulator
MSSWRWASLCIRTPSYQEGDCGARVFKTRVRVGAGMGGDAGLLGASAWRGVSLNCYDANVNGTKPTVEIDHSSPVPLHEQVAAAIRRAIAEGEARSGERLPPARDLAGVLGVNANTVFRALRTLRDEGLVEFRRGRGVSVTGIAPQRSPVVAKARELVAVARRYGYGPEDLAAIIEQVS